MEVKRKTFHLSGLLLPIFYYTFDLPKPTVIVALAVALFVATVLEVCRLEGKLRVLFKLIERGLLRDDEKETFAAYLYFFIGAFLTVAFFSNKIASAALAAALLGDAAAALCGKAFGGKIMQKVKGKSVEGAVVGGVVAGCACYPFLLTPALITAAAISFTLSELLSYKISDNLTTPLFVGLTLSLSERLIIP